MRPKRKRRGNSRYFLFFVLILLFVGVLGTGIYMLLTNVSWFDVTKISHRGNAIIPDSLITAQVKGYYSQNLFTIRSSKIREQFSGIARVKELKIKKKLPSHLELIFTERPATLWLKGSCGNLFPVDNEGTVLENYDGIAKEDLPIMSVFMSANQLKPGTKLHNRSLQKVLALHNRITAEAPDFLPIISEYYIIDNTIHIVDARHGTSIIPSTKDLAAQLKRYQFVVDNGNIDSRSTVDLRYDKQVVVKEGNI